MRTRKRKTNRRMTNCQKPSGLDSVHPKETPLEWMVRTLDAANKNAAPSYH